MSFRKILCPIDFSPGSTDALHQAAQLARESDCELVIGHSWYVPELAFAAGDWMLPGDVIQRMIEDDEAGLAAAVTEASQLGAPRVSSLLFNGAPADQILKTLGKDPAFDLCVVGTHGRTGLKRVLLGSVAEGVVRHAPCSVLAARARRDHAPFKNILCPIDFTDSSRRAIEYAAGLVHPGGTGITLLHAIDLPRSYSEEPPLTDMFSEIDVRATRLLEQWTMELRTKVSVRVAARSRLGHPGAQILAALDDGVFDLVVMGSHGRTGLQRALLGSVAEKVVRHAFCPVFVARDRAR